MKRFKEDHNSFSVVREYVKIRCDVVAGTKEKLYCCKVVRGIHILCTYKKNRNVLSVLYVYHNCNLISSKYLLK